MWQAQRFWSGQIMVRLSEFDIDLVYRKAQPRQMLMGCLDDHVLMSVVIVHALKRALTELISTS